LNCLENFLQDQEICQNLPAWLNDSVPQFPLSVRAKLPLAIQMNSDHDLNSFAAIDFRQLINATRGSWGLSVTLTFLFSSASVFDQLSVKDALQVAKVIRKNAIWQTIDEYLMTVSSRLKGDSLSNGECSRCCSLC
jgi:hypothetical protein